MWAHVETALADIFATHVFKSLLHEPDQFGNVPYLRDCLKKKSEIRDIGALPTMYPGFLFKAGILPEFPTQISQLIPAQRENLREAARLEARLHISNLSSLGAVGETSASVEVVSRRRLFRLWDSRFPSSETGVWWFSEGLYSMVRDLPLPQRTEALRDLLAVSRDWSNLDRLSFLSLEGQELPAIVAQGLSQRYYSKNMWNKFLTGNSPEAIAQRRDYYDNLYVTLRGGKTQFYLPWTPKHLVSTITVR